MTAFPIDLVREQFPALAAPEAFLDNPGGTQVPRRVIDAVANSLAQAASTYTGFFDASRRADAIHAEAHQAAADLLGAASGREIVIGQSMTMLTFQLSRSLGHGWKPGDEVIVTRMDHEGNVSPWLRLAEERQLTVRWLPFNKETWRIEPEDLQPLLNERTRLLALNYASNMTGSINDVAALTKMAKAAGALVYVDAVQGSTAISWSSPPTRSSVRTWACSGAASRSWRTSIPTPCAARHRTCRAGTRSARHRPSCWPG
jgi:selenocysteine lyase/cysteine desulfurase